MSRQGQEQQGDQKPPLRQRVRDGWMSFRGFMWNSEKKEVMGRTGKSWGLIGLFYLCFYTCLAAFWAVLFAIFFQTVPADRPKYTSGVDPPGLAVFPFPDGTGRITYSTAADDSNRLRFEQEINDNVFKVLGVDQSAGFVDCPDTAVELTEPPAAQRFCRYDPSLLGPCAPNNTGYDSMEPCLYIGLNKVWGWIPENYGDGDIPDDLQEVLTANNITSDNRVIFVCQVVAGTATSIDIYPPNGVSFGHYPYVTGTDTVQQARYLRPLVAVKVGLTPGVEVRIECRARTNDLEPANQDRGLFSRGKPEIPAMYRVRLMVEDTASG